MYALMGTGAHGQNGVNPVVSRKIWERYNIPRSTHGLDVQIFQESELKRLQQHETQFLKMYQSLPKFAPNILAHILIGSTRGVRYGFWYNSNGNVIFGLVVIPLAMEVQCN